MYPGLSYNLELAANHQVKVRQIGNKRVSLASRSVPPLLIRQ